jgi:hypothetical protein
MKRLSVKRARDGPRVLSLPISMTALQYNTVKMELSSSVPYPVRVRPQEITKEALLRNLHRTLDLQDLNVS